MKATHYKVWVHIEGLNDEGDQVEGDDYFMPTEAGEFDTEDAAQEHVRLLEAAPDLLAALVEAKAMLEKASRYIPKSIKNPDRFSLLNTLANSINLAIAKATGEPKA